MAKDFATYRILFSCLLALGGILCVCFGYRLFARGAGLFKSVDRFAIKNREFAVSVTGMSAGGVLMFTSAVWGFWAYSSVPRLELVGNDVRISDQPVRPTNEMHLEAHEGKPVPTERTPSTTRNMSLAFNEHRELFDPTSQLEARNKRVYDRVGDQGTRSEQAVSREETLAEIKSGPPRQVYPSAGGVYGPASLQPPAVVAPAPPPASGVLANGEPRRVHTETIRANQVATANIGQPVAPPLASVEPNTPNPASTNEAASTGGYVVQLSSQRTEEEARASFKALASKYASVFGDHEPYIKRITIPEKGTFYRSNVGPFATASEANHFCSNLKIVGGECIVQKN